MLSLLLLLLLLLKAFCRQQIQHIIKDEISFCRKAASGLEENIVQSTGKIGSRKKMDRCTCQGSKPTEIMLKIGLQTIYTTNT